MSVADPDVAAMDTVALVRMQQKLAHELASRHRLATQPSQPVLSPAEMRRRLSNQLDGRPSPASSGSTRQPKVDVDLGVS